MRSRRCANRFGILKQAACYGLFFIACQQVLADDEDIPAFLERITSADKQLSYQGVFVLRKADSIMSMQVSHAVDDEGIRENIVSLNGEARQVMRMNGRVYSIYPERNYFVVSESGHKSTLHPALPENLDRLGAYYDIERLEDDRIANRSAAVIRLRPQDAYRYGYQYWIDDSTGVLLRCDMLDNDGRVIEQMMFTEMEYHDSLPAESFSTPELGRLQERRLGDNRYGVDSTGWQVSSLPAGFMLTQSSSRSEENSESLHLVYSDGLASVSVFIERSGAGTHYLSGATSMGALNAYGTRRDDAWITVMGEVPADTVATIAESTRYAGDGDHD